MSNVGVELGPEGARAVALARWRSTARATWEGDWDPARPAELVTRLRQHFGPASRIGISVGLGFLHVKQVSLPPVPAEERVRMLALEPDRFFPVENGDVVVALDSAGDIAFATDAEPLRAWIRAFESWAPVDRIEAAPTSLGRALGRAASGSFALPAQPDEHGVAVLRDGRLDAVRRVPAAAGAPATQPVPAGNGVAAAFQCAFGVARGVDDPLTGALLPAAHATTVARRRAVRTATLTALCAGSLILALSSVERSRERRLDRVRGEVAALEDRAAPALALREQLEALDREARAVAAIADRRPDPLRVLAALSERLPDNATVLQLRVAGDAWQIEGRARDAAAVLPALDGDERFEDVRFLSASTRFREGDRTWETFSIAFRVRSPA